MILTWLTRASRLPGTGRACVYRKSRRANWPPPPARFWERGKPCTRHGPGKAQSGAAPRGERAVTGTALGWAVIARHRAPWRADARHIRARGTPLRAAGRSREGQPGRPLACDASVCRSGYAEPSIHRAALWIARRSCESAATSCHGHPVAPSSNRHRTLLTRRPHAQPSRTNHARSGQAVPTREITAAWPADGGALACAGQPTTPLPPAATASSMPPAC